MFTILDDHSRQHPGTWRDLFKRYRPPSALALATASLEQCRRDMLHEAQLAEYHTAMVRMLRERETRLQKEVARLSKLPAGNRTIDEPCYADQQVL